MDSLSSDLTAFLVSGLLYTLLFTAITSISSLVAGVGVGMIRLSARPMLSRVAAIYINIFRGVPALVLIILFAFAVPNLFSQRIHLLPVEGT